MEKIKDVHTEHCCQIHGCKYRYDVGNMSKWCSVTRGEKLQSFPCEWCLDDEELREAYEANEMFDRGRRFALKELSRDIVGWKIP
jgi:hypothetical protein